MLKTQLRRKEIIEEFFPSESAAKHARRKNAEAGKQEGDGENVHALQDHGKQLRFPAFGDIDADERFGKEESTRPQWQRRALR